MVLKKTTQALLLCTVALSFSSVANAKPLRHEKAFTTSLSSSDATEFSSRKRTRAHQAYRGRKATHARRYTRVRSVQVQAQPAYRSSFGELPDRHAFGDSQYAVTQTTTGTVGQIRSSKRSRSVAVSRSVAASHDSTVSTVSTGGGSGLVAEARRYLGGNPTGRSSLWCAAFMNLVLERSGKTGTGSNMASSFARYGTRVSGPQVGAIAVMSRVRRGGHVGIVSGIDGNGNPIIISGNHGRRVAESTYSRGRIYAYVMP